MKKLSMALMAAFFVTAVHAQRVVSGVVTEKDTREAVIQATVALLGSDDKVVANGITNTNGQFSVKAPKNGTYTFKITYVGFKPYTRKLTVSGDKDQHLGTITLSPDAIMLKGATVTGQAAKVTLKADTFVYNASAYRTPEGSVVEELVRKLPGAQVDDDGKITINGKEVKKIMIDGKEFMTGDTKTAMKNLPTSIVERVKAYDMKSDLARVSGIDDGEEETVLDFGIKRGMNKGFMLNADVAAGTQDRYSGRLFMGWMKDGFKIFPMLNANNVNDQGFGGGGGRWGRGRQGLTATKMAGLNLNYEKKDRLKLDGSIRWNHSDGDAMVRQSTESFMSSTASTFGNSLNHNFSRSNSWNGQLRLEWMPDTLWNINFRPTFNYNSSDGLSSGNSATFDSDPYAVSGITNPLADDQLALLKSDSIVRNFNGTSSLSYSDSKSVGGTLQINRKLNSRGRNITLRLGGNYSEGMSRSMSNNMVSYFHLKYDSVLNHYVDSTYLSNRYAVTPTKNWNYSVRATYSEPILPRTYLQFSYQFQYKFSKSDRATYDLSPTRLNFFGVTPLYRGWDNYLALLADATPPFELDDLRSDNLSRYSSYKNYIHTAEVMLRVTRKAYNFNVGIQVMPQKSHFTQDYQGVHTDTTRIVTNISPTADFRWKISDVSQLRFNYRGTSSQPSMTDLLDITDDSDPLNIRKGNPGLKPSFTQNFRLFYNNYIQNHQRSIMAHVNFSTTQNSVSNKVTYVEETGGRITRPENINGNWNVFTMFMFNTALDSAAHFNVNTFTTLRYTNSVGYVSVNDSISLANGIGSQKSTTRTMNLSERIAASFRNDWIEFELNGAVDYQRNRSVLQKNNNLDTWTFSYGGSVQLSLPWNMQLSTNLNMNSRRGYNDASMNTNELIWNAQLSQSFLKGNALTLSLQLYDLLHEQSTFSRVVDAMRRSDTEYNAITNYAMLHVIYRLNLFGGMSNMRRGPGQGEGGRRGGGFGGPGGGRPGGGFGGGRPGGRF